MVKHLDSRPLCPEKLLYKGCNTSKRPINDSRPWLFVERVSRGREEKGAPPCRSMDNDEVDGRSEKLHKHFTTSSLSVLLPASFPSPTNIHATRSRMIAEFCNKSRLFITSRSYSSFVLHLLLPLLIFPFYKKKFPSFLFQFSSFKAERGIIATYRVVIRPTWRLSAENEREIRGGCWKKYYLETRTFFSRHFIDDWKFHFHETRADFQLFQLRDSSYREIFRPGGRQVFCKRHVIKRL